MKTILRHLVALVLFLCAVSTSASAQSGSSLTLDEDSFRMEQTDALGGVNIDPIGKDRSNRACFRLKISLNRMTPEEIAKVSVVPVGGNIVLMHSEVATGQNGIIVEMTARPEVRFYIKHPTLGQSNVVTINPEGNKVYLLNGWSDQRLTVAVFCAKAGAEVYLDGAFRGTVGPDNLLNIPDVVSGPHTLKVQSADDVTEQQINVSSAKVVFNVELKSAALLQQFVVFNVTPENALVELDGEMLFVSGGIAQKLVKFGTYGYKVVAKDYHSQSGQVTVNDVNQKKVLDIDLSPAFGWIDITGTSVNGAAVYVDDLFVGQAPLKTGRLASGTHTVKIVRPMYHNYETAVTVTDGRTTSISPRLEADFARVTLTVDGNAEIWVNGELKGSGTWTGDLGSGSYIVECRKASHRPTREIITVTSSMSAAPIRLQSPQPIYGVLSIVSNPGVADVYLDGRPIGQTPLYLPQTLIGNHTLKLSKSGCADWTGSVTISEGQIAEVNATLQSGAPVTFTSDAPDAQLYVDGALMGSANGTYDLSFGSHTAVCQIPGKSDITKTITVTQNGGDRNVAFVSGRETITVNGVSFDMILVEGGTFTMGATSEQGSVTGSDEKPAHQVTLSDYYIGETEVTQALWQAVMGTTVSQQRDKADKSWPLRGVGNDYPMYYISWNECQDFIGKLNSLTGRTFRLPTEAEWEYAARGGNQSKGYNYSGSNKIKDVALYDGNSKDKTHAVKTKSSNELGLYDMSGNVYEWCSDWYGSYSSSSQTNPTGPSSGSLRVLRGGSWGGSAWYCRVSYRHDLSPDRRSNYFGLRLVLVP